MSATEHTPGPWRAWQYSAANVFWYVDELDNEDGFGNLAVCYQGNQEANAARIVECVNACEGLNPTAIKDVVAALRRAEKVLIDIANNAYLEGLEGTSQWDRIAGRADLFGARDEARAALSALRTDTDEETE